MNKILITGATGFLGRHVVDVLLKKRSEQFRSAVLRVLCRSPHTPWRDNSRIEIVSGNVLNMTDVSQAIEGVDGVVHLAGMVKRDPKAAAELFEVHIEGTRNVCEAAIAHGNPTIILSSSSGTVAASHGPVMHNEDSPYAVGIAGRWPYYLSKIYQEKLAFSYWHKHGLPIVSLNPSLILGPGDIHHSSTSDVQMYLDRKILNIPTGGLNFVDVRDVARAFAAALDKPQPGRRYLIGGNNMSVKEFFFLIQYVSGIRAPLISMTEKWARCSAGVIRQGLTLFNQDFPIDDMTIEMAYRFWYFDNSRAKKELGLAPQAAEKTLRDTVAFIRSRSAPSAATA